MKTARIELKVEPEFKARIAEYATKQKRSVTSVIEEVVERELEQAEYKEWKER